MKINVEGITPMFKDEVIKAVESIPEFNFKHLPKEKTPVTTIVFEVDSDDAELLMATVKKAIKATPRGKMLTFRVIPNGSILYMG